MESRLKFFRHFFARGLGEVYYFFLKLHRRLTPVNRLPCPVVSVGNLAVGGRGKTPFVIYLAEQLKARGFSPVVLTRGYGRTQGQPIFLLPQTPVESWPSAAEAGDEPLEIFLLAGVPVLVGKNRYRNAQNFLSKNSKKGTAANEKYVFLLDDGFQHWSLTRNADVVLVKDSDRVAELLPLGELREKNSARARADFIFELGKDFEKVSSLRVVKIKHPNQVVYFTTRAQAHDDVKMLETKVPGLKWRELSDHESAHGLLDGIKALASPTSVFLGLKEAVKVLDPKMLHRFLDEGQIDGDPLAPEGLALHQLVYVACSIKLSDEAQFFEKLLAKL